MGTRENKISNGPERHQNYNFFDLRYCNDNCYFSPSKSVGQTSTNYVNKKKGAPFLALGAITMNPSYATALWVRRMFCYGSRYRLERWLDSSWSVGQREITTSPMKINIGPFVYI